MSAPFAWCGYTSRKAIHRWEPRVVLDGVLTDPDPPAGTGDYFHPLPRQRIAQIAAVLYFPSISPPLGRRIANGV